MPIFMSRTHNVPDGLGGTRPRPWPWRIALGIRFCGGLVLLPVACDPGSTGSEQAMETGGAETADAAEDGSTGGNATPMDGGVESVGDEGEGSETRASDTGGDADAGTDDTGDSDDTGSCPDIDCSPGDPDACGPGHKCGPMRCGDGCCTNASRCVELTGDLGVGERCTRQEVRQVDDCAAGLFCMPDATSTGGGGPGVCEQLCIPEIGGPGNCDELGAIDQHCFAFNYGSFPVCLPTCDPLARDCPDPNDECFLAIDQFFCTQFTCAAECDLLDQGQPCSIADFCRGGMACVPEALQADCDNAHCGGDGCGCCARLCDLEADDPDEACETDRGRFCMPALENPSDAVTHVGACVVPPEVPHASGTLPMAGHR